MKTIIVFALVCQVLNVTCSECNGNSEQCSTAKNPLTSLMEAIGRSVTTSSVVTVNLRNAAILAGVKAIVIIAGILGKLSFWTFPKLGSVRKLDPFEKNVVEEIKMSFMADEDMRWASTYMWSLNKAEFGCFYRLACENPHSAAVYSEAAVILRDISSFVGLLKQKKFYEKIMVNVDQAANTGFQSRSNCKVYKCHSPFRRG